MAVHRSYSPCIFGLTYGRWPLKIYFFKWRNWYGLWRNWCEDFEAWKLVFIVSFFLFLSHRKNCTVKGGLGETYFTFPKWCSNIYIHKPLWVKPLETSRTADDFASDSDEVYLVADEFGQAEELGFCQCDLPIMRNLRALKKLRVQFFDHCCAVCQLLSGSLS